MSKSIIIEVKPDGNVVIEAVGFQGSACEQATKAAEEALGMVAERKRKAEYYATATIKQKQIIR